MSEVSLYSLLRESNANASRVEWLGLGVKVRAGGGEPKKFCLGQPNHHHDQVDSDQEVVSKELSPL